MLGPWIKVNWKQSNRRWQLSVLVSLSQTWWTFQKPAGLSVRSVGSTSPTKWHSTRRARILCMPRESGVMTGNRVAMVGRLSRFSGKSLKLQRRLYWGLNVLSPTVGQRECWLLRDASILSWEVIRRERAKWSSFELHILFYYEDSKNAINKILLFKKKKKNTDDLQWLVVNLKVRASKCFFSFSLVFFELGATGLRNQFCVFLITNLQKRNNGVE